MTINDLEQVFAFIGVITIVILVIIGLVHIIDN